MFLIIMVTCLGCTTEFVQKYDYARKKEDRQYMRRLLEQEVARNSRNGQAWLYLSQMNAEDQRWEEFMKTIRNAEKTGVPISNRSDDLYKFYLSSLFNKAVEAFNKDQFESAISSFKNVLTLQPENFEAIRLMAEAEFELKHWVTAKTLFEKYLSINKKDIRTLSFLAHIALQQQNHAEVQKYGEQVLALRPATETIRRMVAYSYEATGDEQKAIQHYAKLIKSSKRLNDYKALAVLYFKNGQIDEAIQVYRLAEKISADKAPIYRALAQCYIITQQYDQLIRVAKRLMTINSEKNEAKRLLIMAYTILGKEEKLEAIIHQEVSDGKKN